jgi:hypothetical protein
MSAMGLVTTLPSAIQQANLSLDFVNQQFAVNGTSKTFNDLFTFARTSQATYFGSDGLVKYAAANTPRFNYDPATKVGNGLLIEESRTNLLKYTERLEFLPWTRSAASIVPGAAIAPDGRYSADKLIENTANSAHYQDQVIDGTYTTGQVFSGSIFLKAAERTRVRMNFYYAIGASGGKQIIFDLSTKTIVSQDAGILSSGTIDMGNGWVRCWFTAAVDTPAETRLLIRTYLVSTGSTSTYTGDGLSGVYAWGAQVELGAFPTMYIPSEDTFTSRTSIATYYNNAGVLQTAASGVGRTSAFEYDSNGVLWPLGLLAENASTNLLLRSEVFDNASWAKTNVTAVANGAIAPDGTMSMDLLRATATVGNHTATQTVAATASTTYTASVFIKAGGYTWGRIRIADSVGFLRDAVIDLTNGAVFNPSTLTSVENVGNGIYRVSIVVTTAAAATNLSMGVWVYDNTRASSFAGDGVSGIYAWGAQIEAGSFSTSYIPTTTAAVTRAGDVTASVVGVRADETTSLALDTAWFNAAAFTVYSEAQAQLPRDVFARVYEMSAIADNLNRFGVLYNQNLFTGKLQVVTAGTNVADILSPTIEANTIFKAAVVCKVNDYAASYNGATTTTDTAGALPTGMERLYIGYYRAGGSVLNGHVRKIQVFNRRLTNAVLQILSS